MAQSQPNYEDIQIPEKLSKDDRALSHAPTIKRLKKWPVIVGILAVVLVIVIAVTRASMRGMPVEKTLEDQALMINEYEDDVASIADSETSRMTLKQPDILTERTLALPNAPDSIPDEGPGNIDTGQIKSAGIDEDQSEEKNKMHNSRNSFQENKVNESGSVKKTSPYNVSQHVFKEKLTPEERELKQAIEADLAVALTNSSKNTANKQYQMMDQQTDLMNTLMNQLNGSGGAMNMLGDMDPSGMMGGMFGESYKSQNMQGDKLKFINSGKQGADDGYLSSTAQYPKSPYEVKAGAVIPISLITAINSDLPGDVIGQVRENVYDSITGQHLLVPHGSKIMAKYDSMVAYGQDRVLVCWNRLIRPDGVSIDLQCSPGVDLAGQAGYSDDVDNHWERIIGGIVLSSTLAASVTKSGGVGNDGDFNEQFSSNVGNEINNVGQQITKKNINIQPTIKVRPGYSLNILVNRDFILPVYR